MDEPVKRKSNYQKKVKPRVDDAAPPIVPVSQTHKVQVIDGSVRSAVEAAHRERQDMLKDAEDELLTESLAVVAASVAFAEIEGNETAPSAAFLEKFKDHPDPHKLHRIMRAANKSAKEAPVGLMIAQRTGMGIIKARAAQKADPQPLAVAVQVVTTLPEFKVLHVKGE